jgi:hypothetical protein
MTHETMKSQYMTRNEKILIIPRTISTAPWIHFGIAGIFELMDEMTQLVTLVE